MLREVRVPISRLTKEKKSSHIANLSFDVVNSTGGLRVKCYGLSSKRLDKNLHGGMSR